MKSVYELIRLGFKGIRLLALFVLMLGLSGCLEGNESVDNFLGEIIDEQPEFTLSFNPSSYDFGPVLLPAVLPVTLSVTVTNSSQAKIFIPSVNISGDSDLNLDSDTCTGIAQGLDVNQTCNLNISFLPTSGGVKSKTLAFSFGPATLESAHTSSFTFTGTGATPAVLAATPATPFDFQAVVFLVVVGRLPRLPLHRRVLHS